MENLFIAIVMLALFLDAKGNILVLIIAIGSVTAIFIDLFIVDIAVFYSLNSLIASVLAYASFKLVKNYSSKVYAIMMIIQALLCFLLVPCWSEIANNVLQSLLYTYNENIYIVILSIGIINSDIFSLRIYSCNNIYDNSSCDVRSCDHKDNQD